ncbi:MAG: hypothetical protein GY849_06305 [Deltaproteobacteria bacterium]|nr:hypothetical protein [Deltaproteobacteria bacterium]
MSLKKSSLILCLLFIIPLLCGCPYSSNVPLSASEDAEIDETLLGDWTFVDKKGNRETEGGVITFIRFNDHEYLLVMKKGDEIARMRAFVTRIDGYQFLNWQEIKEYGRESRRYGFIEYKITSKNEVLLRTVEGELFDEEFQSSEELFNFLKSNITNSKLYNDFGRLIRFVK